VTGKRLTCLIGALIFLIAGWLLFTTPRPAGKAGAVDADRRNTKTLLAASEGQGSKTSSRVTLSTAGQVKEPETLEESKWLAAHNADVSVVQRHEGKLAYPGSIRVGAFTSELGETPPLYHYQLRSSGNPILLGEFDNRKTYERTIRSVKVVGGKVELYHELSISFPRFATMGGFVFRREQNPISEVGVIIPNVTVPTGEDPSSESYIVMVRFGRVEEVLDPQKLAKLTSQPINDDYVVLMSSAPNLKPAEARILWLKIGRDGSFEIKGR
jgi:hypothetical protein